MLPPTRLFVLLACRVRGARPRGDAGDVPGWVMVTVMTAAMAAAVFAVFRDAIVVAVQNALDQVVSETRR